MLFSLDLFLNYHYHDAEVTKLRWNYRVKKGIIKAKRRTTTKERNDVAHLNDALYKSINNLRDLK